MSNNSSLLQNISDLELTINKQEINYQYPWQNLSDGDNSCLRCSTNPCICNQSKQQNNGEEINDKLLLADNNFNNLEVNHHSHLHHNHNHSHGELDFHVLPAVSQTQLEEVVPNPEISLASTSLDLSQTFFLNSNPGAKHTIYLDFDGHTTTNTSWNSQYGINSIYTPAYDFDNNTSSFSDSELARIQHIWQRVVEDFLPFDVNVTTEDPGTDALRRNSSVDQTWGTRIVIGGNSQDWFGAKNAGGVAYIGSFDWFSDTPAFVFEDNLSNGNEKFVAEAITHEVGHTLSLNHDGIGSNSYYSGNGSGATGWAPIMGIAYYKEVTQWSKGEYNNANNLEDDLSIITTRNGFSYREDDHGNTNTSATALDISGQSFTGNGIIERNTDYDVFSFTTDSGTVSLDILPGQRGANLDILALLYDSQGNLMASSNPFEQLSASFDLNLEAGEYYLHVTGTGKEGAYSDYGSLGQYSISGTVVAIEPDFVSIEATNASLQEGNSGSTAFTFTITRTGDLNKATSVEYQVIGNGSTPASGEDFVAGVLPNGIVDFGVNESSKVITIKVNGDLDLEEDESFTVRLQNPTGNTVISSANAYGTIINDDVETEDNSENNSEDIVGTLGKDKLIGSYKNERIIGLGGSDDITTGEGKDVIVINTADEGLDHILDFDPTHDKIDITRVLDSIGYTGDDPFTDKVLRLQPLSFGGEHHVRLDVDADANYGNGFEQLVFLWDTHLDTLDANNFITTTSSNEIFGTVGNDQLMGSSENERFIPLGGTDTITTGEGKDVIVINTADEGLDHILDFDPTHDKIDITGVLDSIGYTGDDPFTDKVLRLQPLSFGGEHHVRLDVDADANYGNGFEQLVFLWDTSIDTLDTSNNFIGWENNQTPPNADIIGSAGNDQLTGLSGDDRIVGLGGSDEIITGEGNDVIVFNSVNEGLDHILDFDPNQDKIDIVGVLDSIGYTGNDPLGDKVIRLQPLSFGGEHHVRLDVDGDANYGNGFEQLAFLWDTNLSQLDVANNLII